jgi:hypothetical protein
MKEGVALGPQLILGCRWYAPLLTRSVNTRLALAELEVELLDVTGLRLVAEAAGDLWSKSAVGAALAGRLVVEVG